VRRSGLARLPVPASFSWHDCLDQADRILSGPPAFGHIVRPRRRGQAVARFALPLDLCRPQNRTRHVHPWRAAKDKSAIRSMLIGQCYAQGQCPRSEPLPGRPQVLAVRFSSVEPDKYADWAKSAVDRLTGKHGGLGYIQDDAPRFVDLHQWWERAPKGEGFVMLEVRTG